MRLNRKSKKLKPVLVDIEQLARKEDIDAIISKIEAMQLTDTERKELKILSDWNKMDNNQKKLKFKVLSLKDKYRLLGIINKWQGGQDGKSQ